MMYNFFETNQKLCVKIMMHLVIILSVADCIWIYLFKTVWANQHNYFYSKLESLQNFVFILALIELVIKLICSILLVIQYRIFGGNMKDFLDFTYMHDLDGYKADFKIINNNSVSKINKQNNTKDNNI